MHPYSSSCESRVRLVGLMGAISVPLAWLLSEFLKSSGADKLWFVDYPSVMGVFAIVYGAFEVILWRVFRRVGLVFTPFIGGVWDVTGKSSRDNFQSTWTGVVTIRQSWSRVMITLETNGSISHSLSASFFGHSHLTELSYEYLNEPVATSPATMHSHRGVARLRLKSNTLLIGDYFSGRGRGEYGEIELNRRKKI